MPKLIKFSLIIIGEKTIAHETFFVLHWFLIKASSVSLICLTCKINKKTSAKHEEE